MLPEEFDDIRHTAHYDAAVILSAHFLMRVRYVLRLELHL